MRLTPVAASDASERAVWEPENIAGAALELPADALAELNAIGSGK